MSLENVAASLFNFDPTVSLQRGTAMGAQMMEIALREQQMKFDVAAQHANATLSAERNSLARRSQMFNELTENLNRFDRKASEAQAASFNQGLVDTYAGGGESSSSSSVDYPDSTPAPAPAREFSYAEAGPFNTVPDRAPAPAEPPQEQSIRTNQPMGAPSPTPIGGSAPAVQGEPVSFSGAPAPAAAPAGPDIRTIQGSASARMDQRRMGRNVSLTGREAQPRNDFGQAGPSQRVSFAEGPTATPMVRENGPAPATGTLPNFLETDERSKVSPAQLHGFMRQRIANSQLNGLVPKDGARFGIKSGSPDEWADYFTGLANLESGFGAKVVGDVGRFPGNSNGLYQLSPNDAINHGIRDTPFIMSELQDPTFNADAAVKIHEKLIREDGVIAEGNRGAARYWGPLRRGITPQTQSVVQEARGGGQDSRGPDTGEGQVRGMAGGPGVIDGGLFPGAGKSQQFYGPAPESAPATDLPEAAAAAEARRGAQETLQAKIQSTQRLYELRTRDLELGAAASAIDLRVPGARAQIGQINMERARVKSELEKAEQLNREILNREQTYAKSLLEAESALKIAQDRQRGYQKAIPEAGRKVSPDEVFDRYVDADPRTRMKMKASFVNDKEMMARLEVADEFLKSQGGVSDDRTWKIGGSEYSLTELVEFYQNPGTLEAPNPVREFVDKDPKLKREVETLLPQGAQGSQVVPASPAPAAGGDPVKAKIDSLF